MRDLILVGDVIARLRGIPDDSVQCVVTSPPYWGLRDYGVDGQIGLEPTPGAYLERMVIVFREIRRVLRSDGTCWVNMGDSYSSGGRESYDTDAENKGKRGTSSMRPLSGLKPKDLIGMPWMLAFALRSDGWYLRQDIIWNKNNPMPESVTDRCTKAHEYIFLLSKSEDYFYDAEAIKEKASENTHARGKGVNPKAKKEGQHSRMRVDRDPRHMKDGTPRKDLNRHVGRPPQANFSKLSAHGSPRSKQNESFSGAVNEIVTHRNKRSVWTFATAPFKKAHFATFPPALPRFCILAGTSEHGSCATCGRPFARIVERYDTGLRQKSCDGWDTSAGAHGTIHREGREEGEPDQIIWATRTIGWESECCPIFGGGVKPCLVLDPFAGAATTGLVALQLGRDFLGIELNPEYAQMARERLAHLLQTSITNGVNCEA